MAIPPSDQNANEDFNAPPEPISPVIPDNTVDATKVPDLDAEPVDLSGVNDSLRETTPNVGSTDSIADSTQTAEETAVPQATPAPAAMPSLDTTSMQTETPAAPAHEPTLETIVPEPMPTPVTPEPVVPEPVVTEPVMPQETPAQSPIVSESPMSSEAGLAGETLTQTTQEEQGVASEEMHKTLDDGLITPVSTETPVVEPTTQTPKKSSKGLFILLFFLVLTLLILIGVLAYMLLA